ncbi:MAG: hypothetical protein RIR00_1412 [Pseudomonadota bacterium]|jgi:hypothetical protein
MRKRAASNRQYLDPFRFAAAEFATFLAGMRGWAAQLPMLPIALCR